MDEEIIAKWTEPEIVFNPEIVKKYTKTLMLICVPLCIATIILGWFLKEVNYYLTTLIIILFAFYSIKHKKNPSQKLEIIIKEKSIKVGHGEYNFEDLGGFWAKNYNEQIEINLEYKKPKLLPITFYYANSNIDEAKKVFLQFLPEVAPRDNSTNDIINSWFNW